MKIKAEMLASRSFIGETYEWVLRNDNGWYVVYYGVIQSVEATYKDGKLVNILMNGHQGKDSRVLLPEHEIKVYDGRKY